MRGTRSISQRVSTRIRIIPAYAGNTRDFNPGRSHPQDHPRVCGEHWMLDNGIDFQEGSSPRMRGTPLRWAVNNTKLGIIPAYAGNTWWISTLFLAAQDHPRVCGEHSGLTFLSNIDTGSSPRMRGTRSYPTSSMAIGRIIPAYAGNTSLVDLKAIGHKDHPRVCGEHLSVVSSLNFNVGSSPRMRGTPPRKCRKNSKMRIIPAYAGNTVWKYPKAGTRQDHPRVCGEHVRYRRG